MLIVFLYLPKNLEKLIFQEFLLNAIHNVVHGSAHAATNLMHNIFGMEKRDAPLALSAKEEVCHCLTRQFLYSDMCIVHSA